MWKILNWIIDLFLYRLFVVIFIRLFSGWHCISTERDQQPMEWIWACQCNKIRMHLVVTRQILLFYSLYLSGEDHKNDFLDYILVWLLLWCLLYVCVLCNDTTSKNDKVWIVNTMLPDYPRCLTPTTYCRFREPGMHVIL